jgi:hypothetical protein
MSALAVLLAGLRVGLLDSFKEVLLKEVLLI